MSKLSITRLCEQIVSLWPPERFAQVTTLVGVSGGADSVCLLRCLHEIRSTQPSLTAGRLVVGHFNHLLRGKASERDAQFVADLANELGLESIVENAPPIAELSSGPVSEDRLRELRYAFFERAANRVGARYVALAHTASDVAETSLHHIFRGTGSAGLSGIPAFRNLGPDLVVARPMIGVQRSQVLAALAEWRQDYCHDESNDAVDWNRNWLRNVILPALRERYPDVDAAIPRAARLLIEQRDDLRTLARQWIADQVIREPERLMIHQPPTTKTVFVTALMLLWDELGWSRNKMTETHWTTLWRMANRRTDRRTNSGPEFHNLPGNLRARWNPPESAGGRLVVVRQPSGD